MTRIVLVELWTLLLVILAGCASPRSTEIAALRPSVAPATRPAGRPSLKLDRSSIRPIERDILAIDLPAVIQVARASNLDVRLARERVAASRGRLESTVGAIVPVLTPGAQFEHVEGTVRATPGDLVGVGFNTFQLNAAVQAVLNPPRVIYDVIASQKRLIASEHEEQAVVLETLRQVASGYYALVLAQARVAAAKESLREADEFLRMGRLREQAGTAVHADVLRAESRHAEREQDVVAALNAYDNASIALALALCLDAAVTLVPQIDELTPLDLVRADLSLDDLLATAVEFRPDLARVRALVDAAEADHRSVWWGAFGPQFQVGYQYGGITGHANNVVKHAGTPSNLILNPFAKDGSFSSDLYVNNSIKNAIARNSQRRAGASDKTFGFSDQRRFGASAGWRLGVSAFGDLKTAEAMRGQSAIAAERLLDQVRAEVVAVRQSSRANEELIGMARRQLASAEESLRLSQVAFKAGTATTLDVLQAQDAIAQARLRFAGAVVEFNRAQVNLVAAMGLLEGSTFIPGS